MPTRIAVARPGDAPRFGADAAAGLVATLQGSHHPPPRISASMALADEIGRLAGVAERLKGPVGNKANTKALLIEPMLSALGWDTSNLEQTVRDWPLRENVSLDYALRVGDANAMFVEVRGANQGIEDEAFVRQTVEQVSDAGVAWCVLTNGLSYRVYKANESVPTEQRLFLEVDLGSGAPAQGLEKRLSLIGRESVIDGSLQRAGDQVFTDPRVHGALVQLAANPSAAFLQAVAEAIGGPGLPTSRLRESLARVFGAEAAAPAAPSTAPAAPAAAQPSVPKVQQPPAPPKRAPSLAPTEIAPPPAPPPKPAPPAAPPPPKAPAAEPAPPPEPLPTAAPPNAQAALEPAAKPARLVESPPRSAPPSERRPAPTAAPPPVTASAPAVATPADSVWERALPVPDALPANAGPMPELSARPEPPAAADPAWARELAEPPAPATPALPHTSPEQPQTAVTAAVPDSAWTSELPAAPDAPAPPRSSKVRATPEDAWALQLPAIPGAEPVVAAAPPKAAPEGPHTLGQHLEGKPAAIVDLFGQLDEYGRSLDATRRIRPQHVEYLRGETPCFTMEVQRERVLLCLALDAATVQAWWWSPSAKEYTIEIRQRASGEMEFSVGGVPELDHARQLIKLACSGPSAPPAKR
jgi:hypothetical protein